MELILHPGVNDKINLTKLERDCVSNVYDEIAADFSKTRYRPWPNVRKFVESLPPGSMMYDVGCGNGKNLSINKSIVDIGCDSCLNLLQICAQQQKETFVADVCHLPFRSESADACICIAVLHHLASDERRVRALEELLRVLRLGGQALIYVWAFEQNVGNTPSKYIKATKSNQSEAQESNWGLPVHENRSDFKSQDVLVPFHSKLKNKSCLRYYHVFKEGELEQLVNSVSNCKVRESYYDQGNWCVIIEKIS